MIETNYLTTFDIFTNWINLKLNFSPTLFYEKIELTFSFHHHNFHVTLDDDHFIFDGSISLVFQKPRKMFETNYLKTFDNFTNWIKTRLNWKTFKNELLIAFISEKIE